MTKYALNNKNNKLCLTCGDPVSPHHFYCNTHLIKHRLTAKELRAERKARGVCTKCEALPVEGYLDCQPCLTAKAEATKKTRLKTMLEVQVAYGGKCTCCGETEPKFLTMDHINGDGAEHRRSMSQQGSAIYTWVKQNGFPKTLRLMCFNCNSGRQRNGGVCPHITNG